MRNIWEFMYQTITVSTVACLLLVLKRMLADKLSPRWQYAVWSVLALRMLIPADPGRTYIFSAGIWVEMLKTIAERNLNSSYAAVYEPIAQGGVFPVINAAPQSITDWLFLIYAAGVVIMLARYAGRYIRLRIRLRQSEILPEMKVRIEEVAEQYHLRLCRVTAVRGLPSAFVCGVIHPVLVVPAEELTDKKVILHELLHLRYYDSLQNLFWYVLRAFHWCNPLLLYVFSRIGNDMESLCDQRVLELLEGEERREYGHILLNMVNEKYARCAGTSSISNGGRNISRRIQAIVRFKKYPRGMALVSVCILIVLSVSILAGAEGTYGTELIQPQSGLETAYVLAKTRLNRCTTLAGALDTYAKGLLYRNGIYLAAAMPSADYAQIYREIYKDEDDVGEEFAYVADGEGYSICNLRKTGEDEYEALLLFCASAFLKDEEITEGGTILVPVRIFKEGQNYVAEENAPREVYPGTANMGLLFSGEYQVPVMYEQQMETAHGKVGIQLKYVYEVEHEITQDNTVIFQNTGARISPELKRDAVFESYRIFGDCKYDCSDCEEQPLRSVSLQLFGRRKEDDKGVFDGREMNGMGGSSSDGLSWENVDVTEEWNKVVTSALILQYYEIPEEMEEPPVFDVRIIWDEKVVEELTLEGVTK